MRAALLLAAVAAQTLLSLHAVKGDDAPAEGACVHARAFPTEQQFISPSLSLKN